MKAFPAFTFVLLLTGVSLGQFVPTSNGPGGWGPSWASGGPPGGLARPTKFETAETRSVFSNDESRLGLEVRFWCDGQVVPGHAYQLLYQLRLQTKQGAEGPILGTASQPAGTAFILVSATAGDNWNGLEGAADVTRKELSAMTNLPTGKTSTLRIEPQLLDVTTGKYLTPAKSKALLIEVDVNDNGRVNSVLSLANWIVQNAQSESEAVLATLAELDEFDAYGNRLGDAFGKVLANKEIPASTRLRLIRFVSKDWVYDKESTLCGALNELAAGDDADLRAAARKLLATEAPTPSRAVPPSAPAEPSVPAQPSAPATPAAPPPTAPSGLVPSGKIGTGQLFIATVDNVNSAKRVLATAARRMTGLFDAKPAFLGAYGDDKDHLITAAFKAKQKGIDVRGLVIASVGPKGGSAAVAFDRADAALSTLPKLLATLPHGPLAWQDASTADGSIRLRLPAGWQISGAQGMCDIAGTEGQFMSLGIHVPVNTPEAEQAMVNEQIAIGIPQRGSGMLVAPFADPATAVGNVFPQMYQRLAASGRGDVRFGKVIESTKAPVPAGLTGEAGLVHYTIEADINHTHIRSHVLANVICSPLPEGRWQMYYSQVGAPEVSFSRDLPVLLEAWKGYTVSNAEMMRRMDDALQSMRETNRLITDSAANARHVTDRCNADYDEVIHGYRTIEDTETGKWSEVDLGWSKKIVEKLNEHAGYDRFKEIPLRDQVVLP